MNILFLPIDIDLSHFDFTQLDDSTKLKSFNPYWDSSLVTPDTVIKNGFNRILDQLPLTKITMLSYKIQKSIVGEHVDVYPEMNFKEGELEHIKANEPSGYRFVIKGATDSVEVFNGKEWVTACSPAVPCCYLLNATSGKHRVKADPDRRIIYVRGFLDQSKHRTLIEKSYSKYKDYAITRIL